MARKARLTELYASIKKEVEFVDVKPYSHNIISLILRTISKEFGYNKANEAIDKFNLASLGWQHKEEPINNRRKEMDERNLVSVEDLCTIHSSNRNRKNWTATDITKLMRMYSSGRLPVAQIADRLNRTYSAVVKKAERMGLTFKKKK